MLLLAGLFARRPRRLTTLLATVRATLHDRFGVDHLTLQVKPRGFEEKGCCS